jgi:hypothetical protein
MWLAKQAATTRRGASRMMSATAGPTVRSLATSPSRSAFVESDSMT